ncbi:MAG: hypothetical protein U1E60_10950 [Reyranellaceae bacterium]
MVHRHRLVSISLALAFVCGGTGAAFAQSFPSMKGAWTGTGTTVVLGPAPHHKDNAAAKAVGDVRLSEMKFTITIDGQQGNRFWGQIASAARTEALVGAFVADGRHFRIVLRDSGILDGTMSGDDKFEVLYSDAKPNLIAVGTNEYTRQK